MWLLITATALWGSAALDGPTWSDDVRPILAEHCFECHGPDDESRAGRLRLDVESAQGARGLSDVVVARDVEASELFYRVSEESGADRMPPAAHGPSLDARELETLRRWIEGGAKWTPHWAYAPFGGVAVPSVANEAWPRNAIDRFVLARLEREGLAPSPRAEPRALLRRLHLDLTGLPPTPEEVEAYFDDATPDAYERRVDELLASVHFAERWARHWLDCARYADSHGYTIDGARSMWPWRDWVIDSIDRDQPYDAFTIEQLAGDLLPGATREQRLATGFHRNTQINEEGGADDEENRIQAVFDRVHTTGAVWLGATFSCAQCHTHKFDPLTHAEFFRFFAFFDQTRDHGVSAEPALLAPRDAEETAVAEAFERRAAELTLEERASHAAATAGWQCWQPPRATASNGAKLRPREDGSYSAVGQNAVYSTYVVEGPWEGDLAAVRLEALPDADLPAGGPGRAKNGNFVLQRVRLLERSPGAGEWRAVELAAPRADFSQETSSEGGARYSVEGVLEGAAGPGWAVKPRFGEPHAVELALASPLRGGARELRLELVQEHGDHHTLGRFRVALAAEAPNNARELVAPAWREAASALREHLDAPPAMPTSLVLEARGVPRVTRRFHRGSFLDPREVVTPGFPAAFDHFGGEEAEPATRLDLARWLVDPRNALAHRVTVNRWWQRLFGRGLVATENDFGLRGARPTHPLLLEWLAQELVRSGMSRKHLIRTIVTSETYRQSSRAEPSAYAADPANERLARQASLRLEGEVLRDSMLVAAGRLCPDVGGPPVRPPQPEGAFEFTQNAKRWEASTGADRFRRSLYTYHWRTAPFPFYAVFDAPPANSLCTRRESSTSPLQALALANDPLVHELAQHLGARVRELDVASDEERARRAFEWCLARPATDAEVRRLLEHVAAVRAARGDEAAWTAAGRVLFALDEFRHRP